MTNGPRTVDFLLVGGGVAGATAAETLRLEGAEGSGVIVSAEERLPYHRPALSARRMKSDISDELRPVLNQDDCRARDIELLGGMRVVGVEAKRHLMFDSYVDDFTVDHLLASGSLPPGLSMVDEATAARIRQLPPYVDVMGAPDGPRIRRIVREGSAHEPAGRDFDFSLHSIQSLMQNGLRTARMRFSLPKAACRRRCDLSTFWSSRQARASFYAGGRDHRHAIGAEMDRGRDWCHLMHRPVAEPLGAGADIDALQPLEV